MRRWPFLDRAPRAAAGTLVSHDGEALRRWPSGEALTRRPGRPVVAILPAEDVLLYRKRLPIGARARVDDVLALEVPLDSPFDAGDTAFGHRLVTVDDHMIEIEVALARKAALPADQDGVTIDAIDLADAAGTGRQGFDLLPAERRPSPPPWLNPFNRVALAVAVMLAAGLGGLEVMSIREARSDLDAALAPARAAADEAQRSIARFEAARRTLRRASDALLAAPSATAVVEQLAVTLPDEVWIETLELKGADLTLSGYAPRAAPLIALLEQAPLFSAVGFAAPSAKVERRGKERFSVRMQVGDRP